MKAWTEHELGELRKNAGKRTSRVIAKMLNRSWGGTYKKMAELGLDQYVRGFLDPVRRAYAERFKMGVRKIYDRSDEEIRQLGMCRSDEARRILLGVTEKGHTGHVPGPHNFMQTVVVYEHKRGRRPLPKPEPIEIYAPERGDCGPEYIDRMWALIRLGARKQVQSVRPAAEKERMG